MRTLTWPCLRADYVGCFLRYSLVVHNQASKWYELKDKAVFLG